MNVLEKVICGKKNLGKKVTAKKKGTKKRRRCRLGEEGLVNNPVEFEKRTPSCRRATFGKGEKKKRFRKEKSPGKKKLKKTKRGTFVNRKERCHSVDSSKRGGEVGKAWQKGKRKKKSTKNLGLALGKKKRARPVKKGLRPESGTEPTGEKGERKKKGFKKKEGIRGGEKKEKRGVVIWGTKRKFGWLERPKKIEDKRNARREDTKERKKKWLRRGMEGGKKKRQKKPKGRVASLCKLRMLASQKKSETGKKR